MWQIQKIPKSPAAVDAVSINERGGGGAFETPSKIKKWNNFKTVQPITAKLSEKYIWKPFKTVLTDTSTSMTTATEF